MARVLLLSDGTCRDLPTPDTVTLISVDGMTVGGLLTLLDRKPDVVRRRHYDVITLHVGFHNLRLGTTVQTLVGLLDLAVLKTQSLCPRSKVVVSSLLPWPSCDRETLAFIQLTNQALSAHFSRRAFLRSHFNMVRGGRARPEMFVGGGPELSGRGRESLWAGVANFLRYLRRR